MAKKSFNSFFRGLFDKHVCELGEKDFLLLPEDVQDMSFQWFVIGHGEGMNTFKKINFKLEADVKNIKKLLNITGRKESTRWKKKGLDTMPKMEAADELLLDVLWQACGEDEDGLIDNRCLSSYEQACTYLCERGLLVPDSKKSGRIYFLARKKDLKSTINGGKI